MASARSNTVLVGEIGRLYNLGAVGSLSDGELLDRYLSGKEPSASEAAFSALVDRHGAMVLSVCQRVLQDPHDAHDAFQATFLVLVRKAESIRRRESVAGWLYGIARRVSARARVDAARRRRHLASFGIHVSNEQIQDRPPTREGDGNDLGPLIAEIDRLPARFRDPVVLHYFEGLSTEATAMRLGCPRGTVLSRLARARDRLRSRLERRGESLEAIVPASVTAPHLFSNATVPGALSQATVRSAVALRLAGAAIERIVPAAVASLSSGVVRNLTFAKVRMASALMVLGLAGAAVGSGLIGPMALSLFTVNPIVARAQVMKAPATDKTAPTVGPARTDEKADRFEYAGRVLGPDSKPVAGAKLHVAYFRYMGKSPLPIRATTGADGRFRFAVTKKDFSETDNDTPWTTAIVVAQREGLGLGWADAGDGDKKKINRLDLTLQLARDVRPIAGRIVDLQGKPIAGVTIEPGEIFEPEDQDLNSWITASRSAKAESYVDEPKYLTRKLWSRGSGIPTTITTNRDGLFSIVGVGRERLIRLKLSGPTVQTKEISVLTRPSDPFRVTNARGSTDWGVRLYYGEQFTHAAAPTKPVVGMVKDKETGRPLAGVRIECNRTAEYPVRGPTGIETTTDSEGRYRLIGMLKGRGNHVVVIPAKNQPFLRSGLEIPDSPGLEPTVFDIPLTRGIAIQGKVIDKVTGKPLKAFVEYNAFRDNPNLSTAPGFDGAYAWGANTTEPDGSFQVVGLPGHGLLSAMHIGGGDRYMTGIGLPKSLARDHQLGVVPNGMQMSFNTFAELDLPKDSTTIRRDLALEAGITRTVRVVGPDGNPLPGAQIKFVPEFANFSEPQASAEVHAEALKPKEVRLIEAYHTSKKLAGQVEVHADKDEVELLKLEPWGSVVGTLVDDDGQPRANVDLQLKARWEPVATDSKGRFRIEGFVANQPTEIMVLPKAHFVSGNLGRPISLAPGEVKDMGQVRENKYGG